MFWCQLYQILDSVIRIHYINVQFIVCVFFCFSTHNTYINVNEINMFWFIYCFKLSLIILILFLNCLIKVLRKKVSLTQYQRRDISKLDQFASKYRELSIE